MENFEQMLSQAFLSGANWRWLLPLLKRLEMQQRTGLEWTEAIQRQAQRYREDVKDMKKGNLEMLPRVKPKWRGI